MCKLPTMLVVQCSCGCFCALLVLRAGGMFHHTRSHERVVCHSRQCLLANGLCRHCNMDTHVPSSRRTGVNITRIMSGILAMYRWLPGWPACMSAGPDALRRLPASHPQTEASDVQGQNASWHFYNQPLLLNDSWLLQSCIIVRSDSHYCDNIALDCHDYQTKCNSYCYIVSLYAVAVSCCLCVTKYMTCYLCRWPVTTDGLLGGLHLHECC